MHTQPRRRPPTAITITHRAITRGQLHADVTRWRQQAGARPLASAVNTAPGEGGVSEPISPRRQSVYISLFMVITLLLLGARVVGLV